MYIHNKPKHYFSKGYVKYKNLALVVHLSQSFHALKFLVGHHYGLQPRNTKALLIKAIGLLSKFNDVKYVTSYRKNTF